MKKEYKSSIRSKKLIREAVISLLEKKGDINKISVSDVVLEADINRGTFYNHYKNINEVINEIEDEMMEKLGHVLETSIKKNNPSDFLNVMGAYIKQNEATYSSLARYIPQYVLDDMKERILKDLKGHFNSINGDEVTVNVLLLANGIAGLLIDYFNGKIDMSFDDLISYSSKSLERFLNSR